jgi:hypothetical protein
MSHFFRRNGGYLVIFRLKPVPSSYNGVENKMLDRRLRCCNSRSNIPMVEHPWYMWKYLEWHKCPVTNRGRPYNNSHGVFFCITVLSRVVASCPSSTLVVKWKQIDVRSHSVWLLSSLQSIGYRRCACRWLVTWLKTLLRHIDSSSVSNTLRWTKSIGCNDRISETLLECFLGELLLKRDPLSSDWLYMSQFGQKYLGAARNLFLHLSPLPSPYHLSFAQKGFVCVPIRLCRHLRLDWIPLQPILPLPCCCAATIPYI